MFQLRVIDPESSNSSILRLTSKSQILGWNSSSMRTFEDLWEGISHEILSPKGFTPMEWRLLGNVVSLMQVPQNTLSNVTISSIRQFWKGSSAIVKTNAGIFIERSRDCSISTPQSELIFSKCLPKHRDPSSWREDGNRNSLIRVSPNALSLITRAVSGRTRTRKLRQPWRQDLPMTRSRLFSSKSTSKRLRHSRNTSCARTSSELGIVIDPSSTDDWDSK